MSITDDDFTTWPYVAYAHAELVAQQIVRFRNPTWNPKWQDLLPHNPLKAGWGSRRRRTGLHARRVSAATRPVKGEDEKEVKVFSPETPLDFGSGSGSMSGFGSGSASCGGDEWVNLRAVKKSRTSDDTDVSGSSCLNNNNQITSRKSTARHKKQVGPKRKLCELREEEKLLMAEKNLLQQVLGIRRSACEELKAENQRLKKLQADRIFVELTAAPSSSTQFMLPDLNEPWSEDMN